MANLNGFDADTVEPMDGFEPIPAGKYTAVIIDSEQKGNSAGTGSYLELTFQVTEGEYKNRLLWHRLNLDNPSDTAVKIARAQLSAVCKAVDVLRPADSVQLHNLPLCISVKLERRKDNDELTNVIKGFSKKQAPSFASAGGRAPWQR